MDIDALYNDARSGNQKARAELFEILSVRFAVIAKHRIWSDSDAEDVVQEALTTIAERFEEIEIALSFRAWAHKVLDNKVLSSYKAKQARMSREDSAEPIEQIASSKEIDPNLEAALIKCLSKVSSVSVNYARILNLCYQGYKTDEICDRLGVTANYFYVILFRARSLLKQCLENGGKEK